jgi:hypothetical protein
VSGVSRERGGGGRESKKEGKKRCPVPRDISGLLCPAEIARGNHCAGKAQEHV